MEENISKVSERFFRSDESRIFVLGSCMLILWATTLTILFRVDHSFGPKMLGMGLAHAGGGRAASIAMGMKDHIHRALIAFLTGYLDVMIMFLVYPVIVFSYKNLLERKFFKDYMGPIFDSAQRSMKRLRGFKIVGIFFFVWFPLWMTGIIVGAVIGFLLGLRTWVTMLTVISGTTCAIISWVYVMGEVFDGLSRIDPAVPSAVAMLIVIVLMLLRLRTLRQKRHVVERLAAE